MDRLNEQSSEKLKELLRRIEKIPVDEASRSSPASTPSHVLPERRSNDLSTFSRAIPAAQTKRKSSLLLRSVLAVLGVAMFAGGGVALFAVLGDNEIQKRPEADSNPTTMVAVSSLPTPPVKATTAISEPKLSTPTAAEGDEVKLSVRTGTEAGEPKLAQVGGTNTGNAGTAPVAQVAPSATLKIDVPPITLEAGKRSPLVVRAEPPFGPQSLLKLQVQLSAVGVTVSPAIKTGANSWSIDVTSVPNLEVAVGDAAEGRFPLIVELKAADGHVLARTESQLTILAPVTLADSERLNEEDQSKLLGQGLMMLSSGNVNSSRLLLQRAADAGNAHAALILGDTYDADRLARMGAMSVVPDRDKAAFWYSRADELGEPEAKERIAEMNGR